MLQMSESKNVGGRGLWDHLFQSFIFGAWSTKAKCRKREHSLLVPRLGAEHFFRPLSVGTASLGRWLSLLCPGTLCLWCCSSSRQSDKPANLSFSGASHTSTVNKAGEPRLPLDIYIQNRTESARRFATVSKHAFLPPFCWAQPSHRPRPKCLTSQTFCLE